MAETHLIRFFCPSSGISITSHIYNILTNEWRILKQFNCGSYRDEYACYVIHGDNLYIFDDGRHEQSSVGTRINLRTGQSMQIEHPKLYYMQVVVVDNQLYAFGFFGYKETERIVLRFSCENSRWAFVSRTMKHIWRQSCAVTSRDKFVYVAGGEDESYRQSSLVECFDKTTRKWSKLPDMNRKRCFFILTIINGFMYAIDRKLTTAERYDFERAIWEQVSISGRKPEMYFSAVTVQDRLYAIEVTNGQLYRIDLDANGKKLRLVLLQVSELHRWTGGRYELLLQKLQFEADQKRI